MRTCGLILLFSLSSLAAQSDTLTVKCLDNGGNPLHEIKVFAQGLQSGKTKDGKSNRQGIAVFKGLDDDFYRLWARQEGYEPVLYEFVRMSGGANQDVELVELVFESGNPQKKLYFEDQALLTEASQLLQQGTQALQAQNFAEAEEKLGQAVSIYPSNLDIRHNLAIAYLQQQKWDQAQEQFSAERKLLDVYKVLQPGSAAAFDQRAAELQKVLDAFPSLKLESEVNAAMDQKDYEKAIEKLEEMIRLRPDEPNIFYSLALAQAHANRLEEAGESIEKALKLKPGEQAFMTLRTQIQARQRLQDQQAFEGLVKEVDDLYVQKNYSAALEQYKGLHAEAPQQYKAPLWVQIARCHKNLNNPQEATNAYKQAIELAPDHPNYRKELAQHYFDQQQYEAFLETYVGAMEKGSSSSRIEELFKVGTQSITKGEKQLAGKIFEKVLELDPNFAEGYYELGMHYFYVEKKPAQARQMLQKYVEIGKDQAHRENTQAVLTVIEKIKKK